VAIISGKGLLGGIEKGIPLMRLVCRENESNARARKLSSLLLKTVATSKIRSNVHSREISAWKYSSYAGGFLLLLNPVLKLPSLL